MKNNRPDNLPLYYVDDFGSTQGMRAKMQEVPKRSKKGLVAKVILALGLVCLLVAGGVLYVESLSIFVTLNDKTYEVPTKQALEEIITESGIDPQPGDLMDIDGNLLESGGGEPFRVVVNGSEVNNLQTPLEEGDIVEVTDGLDVKESITSVETAIPYEITTEGSGAIHLIEGEGTDGVLLTETGDVSGISYEEVIEEPSDLTYLKVSPDVGNDKVVALTFDDGPWPGTTDEILDILEEYNVKATFFVLGKYVKGSGAQSVERAIADGHQVCNHTYDHAAGSGLGVNLAYMSPEEQVEEIQLGYDAITSVAGVESSQILRAPGGNFGLDVVANVNALVDAEIGWNIDTRDWERPGASVIAGHIKSAWPGSIVLMHDGGGDRSQTVEALREAIPYLLEKGYTFVTIDELMEYPMK